MYKKKIKLGEKEIELLSTIEREKKMEFVMEDAAAILPTTSRQVIRNMLSNLARKGRIKRIKKGSYLLVPFRQKGRAEHSLALAPLLGKEYYVGFWSALSFWSMTEQLPLTVFIAVRTPKKERVFENTKFKFVTLSERYFFGYETVTVMNVPVSVSSREKTVLDCLLHPQHCGGIGEAAKAIKEHASDLNWQIMGDCLLKMGNSAVERRLRYCLNYLGLKKYLRLLGEKTFVGFRFLDPSAQKEKFSYDKEAGLKINVNLKEAMG